MSLLAYIQIRCHIIHQWMNSLTKLAHADGMRVHLNKLGDILNIIFNTDNNKLEKSTKHMKTRQKTSSQ